MNDLQQTFLHLAVSLAIGLLIGLERGWKERMEKEGERIAGVRTYGLIGLLGGGSALLAEHFGVLAVGLAFLGLAGALTTAYVINLRHSDDVGITSLVASLLTFVLGALAATGALTIASASAVVTMLLLGYKPQLHRWIGALEEKELRAAIKLLLISVVLLPILPDRGFGPWQALNPYEIWWMVVLIAALSFVGYFAIKLGGASRGAVFTGLFAGLASSTALTLHFSRMARSSESMRPMLAIGILLACGTMFPRMVLLASVLNDALLWPLLVPAAVMMVLLYVPALFYLRWLAHHHVEARAPLKNPLEIGIALKFGALLVAVMLVGRTLVHYWGEAGVLALAAASGVADVDAVTLSLARMSQDEVAVHAAAFGIVVAASVNSLVKGGMTLLVGGRRIGLMVGLPLLVSAVGGLLAAWMLGKPAWPL